MNAAAQIAISLHNAQLVARPVGYLGGSFNAYRDAAYSAGAKYDPSLRANVAPITCLPTLVRAFELSNFAVTVSPEVKAQATAVVESAPVAYADEAIQDLLRQNGLALRPFQYAGSAFIRATKRCMLIDDMGLGKSVQLAVAIPVNAPAIIICPATLKGNWRKELNKWRPDLTVTVLKGRGSFNRWPLPNEVLVTNFAILPNEIPGDAPQGMFVAVDEAQNVKGYKTKAHIRTKAICARAEYAIGLTGTPIENTPMELWSLFCVVGCERAAFGSWSNFIRVFNGYKTQYGYEFGAPSPQSETCIRKVALGRKKKDVLKDLPPKTYQDIPVEIDAATAKMCDELTKVLAQRGVSLEEAMGLVEATAHANGPDEMSY